MHRTASLLLAASATFSGCANYDFTKARLPNGELDIPKLMADLKASGKQELTSMVWIPLVYLDLQTFKGPDSGYLGGYVFRDAQAYGPIFCVGDIDRVMVDDQGALLEKHDHFWFGWGIPYHGHGERVETKAGQRVRDDWRVALLIGRDDVCHVRAK